MLPGFKGYFTLDAVPFLGYSSVQYSTVKLQQIRELLSRIKVEQVMDCIIPADVCYGRW